LNTRQFTQSRPEESLQVEEGGLLLNAFPVSFSSETFTAYSLPSGEHYVQNLIENYDGWYFRGSGDKILAVPLEENPKRGFEGNEVDLRTHDRLGLLSSLVLHTLPSVFEDRNPIRRRPLTYTASNNIIRQLADGWSLPSLVTQGFEVHQRYEFDTRIVNPYSGSPFVAVTASVSSSWNISAGIQELKSAGVNLRGLAVLRRNPSPDQSRLVGTIRKVYGDKLVLAEQFEDAPASLDVTKLRIEPSKKGFKRCLSTILGSQYDDFESAVRARIDQERKGPAIYRYLSQLSSHFKKKRFDLAPDLKASIGDPVVLDNSRTEKCLRRSGSIEYCFNPSRTKRHEVPWYGLQNYGPFDRESVAVQEPKILVVCLSSSQGQAEQFVAKLRDGIRDSNQYQSGFDAVFGTYNTSFRWCIVEDDDFYSHSPGRAFSKAIEKHFESLPKRASEAYNAALVVVEQDHAFLSGPDNPYLQAKAQCLMSGVPTQQVRTKTINQGNYSLQYALRNLSTALYAKLGGIPWTVDQDSGIAHELVIGLDTAEIQESRFQEHRRLMGITTVFRGDGSYLLSDLGQKCLYDDYPEVLRETTKRVLKNRRRKDGWQSGDRVRVIFHSFKRLRDVEMARIVAEATAEVGTDQSIEFAFLNISSNHPYYMLDPHQRGHHGKSDKPKGELMPLSGTIGRVSGRKRLVQTFGPKRVPHSGVPLVPPLLITINNKRRERGVNYFDDLTYLSEQVHRFTGLSWKTVSPIKAPVTMEYSKLIAKQLGELEAIPDWSPKALNSRLPTSKWFL
jgi:hypothetical protein